MRDKLKMANATFLLLCVSMYLGTGGSLVLFSFPIAPELTPETYYLPFVPPVHAATDFFTTMTQLMIASGIVMVITEWRSPTRWVPIFVLLAVGAATAVTVIWIFPLNEAMDGHIKDPVELKRVLGEWMNMNRVRTALWCVQWAAMAWYFARWAYEGRRLATANT